MKLGLFKKTKMKMAVSTGLVAKTAAGAAAVASATTLGVVYKDSIFGWEITNEAINEMIKDLGLPVNCKFSNEDEKSKDCGSLSDDDLKKINFEKDKASAVTGAEKDTRTLTIERTDDWKIFPDGFKLIFKTTADLTLVIDTGLLTLKKGTNTEFKMKTVENEKKIASAWTPENIGERVGIACKGTNCTLGEKINVWKGEDDYIIGATIGEKNKPITVTEESEDHNQGFKFTVAGDIALSGGRSNKSPSAINKLTNTNMSYEIGIKEIEGQKIWFLIEKKPGGN